MVNAIFYASLAMCIPWLLGSWLDRRRPHRPRRPSLVVRYYWWIIGGLLFFAGHLTALAIGL